MSVHIHNVPTGAVAAFSNHGAIGKHVEVVFHSIRRMGEKPTRV